MSKGRDRTVPVCCLLLLIDTSVIAMKYGSQVSIKAWPVHFSELVITHGFA